MDGPFPSTTTRHVPAAAIGLAGRAFPVDDDFDFATVLDIRFDPTRRALGYASAGHPPPLILRRSGSFFAQLRPGPPIGAGWSGFTNHSLSLLEGDVVLLYTDGPFERRRQDSDDALELLRVAAHEAFMASMSLDELANTLTELGLSDRDRYAHGPSWDVCQTQGAAAPLTSGGAVAQLRPAG